mgnify:CR=1 FL=1
MFIPIFTLFFYSIGWFIGFYFRNVTELLLFGVRGKNNRTLAPGRSQVNLLRTMKREHSRKPDEFVDLIDACSLGPRLEMFARGNRSGWDMWGNQADESYEPTWKTYANHTVSTASKSLMWMSTTPIYSKGDLQPKPKSRIVSLKSANPDTAGIAIGGLNVL